MTYAGRIAAFAALVALGACSNVTNSGGFDSGTTGGGGADGAVSNPSSPAYFRQSVGDRILFEVDQSSLTPGAQATLQEQAVWLTNNPTYTAVIEGHADEQGTREYNLALGARRANAVREFLVQRGVAGSRLKTVSFGKERPLEVCSAEACYANNRRAVTVLSSDLAG